MECEEETVRKWKKDLEQVGFVDFPGKVITEKKEKEKENGEKRKEKKESELNVIGFMQMQDLFLFQLQQEKRITHH